MKKIYEYITITLFFIGIMVELLVITEQLLHILLEV